jgi:hypothetical protein
MYRFIKFSFAPYVCVREFLNHIGLNMETDAAVLLHFVLATQTQPSCASWGKDFSEMSPV